MIAFHKIGIPIVKSYQEMTKKQRKFFQLAFAEWERRTKKDIPGEEKNPLDKARAIVERKKERWQ